MYDIKGVSAMVAFGSLVAVSKVIGKMYAVTLAGAHYYDYYANRTRLGNIAHCSKPLQDPWPAETCNGATPVSL